MYAMDQPFQIVSLRAVCTAERSSISLIGTALQGVTQYSSVATVLDAKEEGDQPNSLQTTITVTFLIVFLVSAATCSVGDLLHV